MFAPVFVFCLELTDTKECHAQFCTKILCVSTCEHGRILSPLKQGELYPEWTSKFSMYFLYQSYVVACQPRNMSCKHLAVFTQNPLAKENYAHNPNI